MKLLLWPVYTTLRLSRCATFYAHKQIARFALERGWFVYLVVPPATGEWHWDDEFLTEVHPHLKLIPMEMGGDR